jgi:hypothetical protein
MFTTKKLFFLLLSCNFFSSLRGYNIKSYNLNKYPSASFEYDCLHTSRTNISIPQAFTMCYRHKPVVTHATTWSNVFIGNINEDWTEVDVGLDFSIWASGVWIATRDNGTTVWVAMGKGEGFELLAWRHTCLSIDLDDGRSVLYENGELQYEDTFDEYLQFRDKMPPYVNMISMGCAYGLFEDSNVGVVTDFQLFGRSLSKAEMKDMTGCNRRFYGDLLSWDLEPWIFNKTGDVSEVEYLEFEKDVCDMKEKKNHIFPIKIPFSKSLKLCKKVSGKLFQ